MSLLKIRRRRVESGLGRQRVSTSTRGTLAQRKPEAGNNAEESKEIAMYNASVARWPTLAGEMGSSGAATQRR